MSFSIRYDLCQLADIVSITLLDDDAPKWSNTVRVIEQMEKLQPYDGTLLHIDMGDLCFDNEIATHIPKHVKCIWTLNNTCDDPRVHLLCLVLRKLQRNR